MKTIAMMFALSCTGAGCVFGLTTSKPNAPTTYEIVQEIRGLQIEVEILKNKVRRLERARVGR